MSNNNYTWEFPALEVIQQDQYPNVVYNVHWRYNATTGSYTAESYGMRSLQPYNSESGSFIPFDQLTKEIITEWVENSIGTSSLAQMKSYLDTRIDEQINPPYQIVNPPWQQ